MLVFAGQKEKEFYMRDTQLHDAVEHANLNQLQRDVARPAVGTAEAFADAVLWIINKFRGSAT